MITGRRQKLDFFHKHTHKVGMAAWDFSFFKKIADISEKS